MTKKFLLVCLCTSLFISGCQSTNEKEDTSQARQNTQEVKKTSKNQENNFILLNSNLTEENMFNDIDIRIGDKNLVNIIKNNNFSNKVKYLENKKSVIAQDENDNLVIYNQKGEKELIDTNIMNADIETVPFKVSKNDETIVYMKKDNSLYIKKGNEDPFILSNNVYYYEVSDDGKIVYYTDENSNLYVYKDNKKQNLSNYASIINVSKDGTKIVYYEVEENLCIMDINKKNKEVISSGNIDIDSINIYEDGSLMFIENIDYDSTDELCFFENGKKTIIFSGNLEYSTLENNQYVKVDDTFYFLDNNFNLHEKNIKDTDSKIISTNVTGFTNFKDGVLFIDKLGNVYFKRYNKEIQKLGENLLDEPLLKIIDNQKIAYINKNNELILDNQIIAKDIKSFAYDLGNLVYVTKDYRVYSYNLNNNNTKLEFENINDYSYVYLNNELLFYNKLELSDIQGCWNAFTDKFPHNYIIQFKDDNMISHFFEGHDNTEQIKVNKTELNYISLTNKYGTLFEIYRDDKNNFSMSVTTDEETMYGVMLTKSKNQNPKEAVKEYQKELELPIENINMK